MIEIFINNYAFYDTRDYTSYAKISGIDVKIFYLKAFRCKITHKIG